MKKIYTLCFLWIFLLPHLAQSYAITVISPNGGENWLIGCASTIQWISSTPAPVKIMNVTGQISDFTIQISNFTFFTPNFYLHL